MKYKVDINGNNRIYGLNGEMFEAGETVRFKTLAVRDATTSVSSNDVKLMQDNIDYTCYYFTMPENDVHITVSVKGDMMYHGPANMFIGGLMASFIGLEPTMVHTEIEIDENNCQFCPECGAKNTLAAKFCRDCGSILVSKKVEGNE